MLTHPSRRSLLAAVHSSHLVAPLLAVVGSAVLVMALTPRTLLAFVGGALFGAVTGTVYVIVGVLAGACLSFAVGRFLGRAFVASQLRGRFALVEQAVARRGLMAVIIARLIPLVPFGISNYAFGTTSIGFLGFLGGTLVGAAPATVAYAALGAATMKGDPSGATYAGIAVGVLGVGGTIGTYLVWRRRPRNRPEKPTERDGETTTRALTGTRSD
ncbi:TVP38/TMEM64 family protein [Planosporangium thailandense]|uniref:TVP38/TMEM64 family membrane protein n=1 Tax=Planosporangium thailandense TaxID=765197 RepID=A0ABX0Y781_9ACTN|nr:TVP38/TMEM64 family protein [Planosporangium thailandense]